MRIGILAVQGDYEAHAAMLDRLGAEHFFVRTPEDVAKADALILPGGESTTMLKFLQGEGLEAPVRALAGRGGAFLATCAGTILLARDVHAPAQASLGLADIAVTRNAYGRQIASGVRTVQSKLKPEPLEAVFIRAPIIDRVGPEVEVLATDNGHPALVRENKLLMATFHPELTSDTAVHEYFLKIAAEPADPASRPVATQQSAATSSSGSATTPARSA
jgi:5'-phosphate synthase pdxT subunit